MNLIQGRRQVADGNVARNAKVCCEVTETENNLAGGTERPCRKWRAGEHRDDVAKDGRAHAVEKHNQEEIRKVVPTSNSY